MMPHFNNIDPRLINSSDINSSNASWDSRLDTTQILFPVTLETVVQEDQGDKKKKPSRKTNLLASLAEMFE